MAPQHVSHDFKTEEIEVDRIIRGASVDPPRSSSGAVPVGVVPEIPRAST